jgi:hypothetical protein
VTGKSNENSQRSWQFRQESEQISPEYKAVESQ